jgi:hypothetical protein
LILTAAGGWPSVTNGCAANALVELTTNKVAVYVLDFDATAVEYAQWTVVMPSDYDGGTVTAVFHWTAASGSGGVMWGLAGVAYGNDDALDAAFGTPGEASDTLITANDEHISAATPAITIIGTPAASELVQFRVYRDPTDDADTLAVDARLLGVRITFTRA